MVADRIRVLAAAVLFSTGGAAIKATALDAWQVASFRSAVAAVALLLLAPSTRRRWTWRTLLVGLAYAATMILYVAGNKLTTAANTIFLQDTAPLYIVLFGPLLLGERIRRREVVFMAALAVGMALFFVARQPASDTAPNPALGNLLAAAAGVTWALTIVGLRWLGRGLQRADDAAAAVVCGNIIASVAALPGALPVATAGVADAALILYLGVLQIGLAYLFLTSGMRGVPALEASLLLLLEPVLNPVWAWMVHGETPAPLALAGAGVILAATAVHTWREGQSGRG